MMHSCYVFPVKMPFLVIAVHRFSRYSVQLIIIAVISDENCRLLAIWRKLVYSYFNFVREARRFPGRNVVNDVAVRDLGLVSG